MNNPAETVKSEPLKAEPTYLDYSAGGKGGVQVTAFFSQCPRCGRRFTHPEELERHHRTCSSGAGAQGGAGVKRELEPELESAARPGTLQPIHSADQASTPSGDTMSSEINADPELNGERVDGSTMSPLPETTTDGPVEALRDAREMMERIDADDGLDEEDPDDMDPIGDVDDDPDPDADPDELPDQDPADTGEGWSSLDPDAMAQGEISPSESALLAAEAGEEDVSGDQEGALYDAAQYNADSLRLRMSSGGDEPGDSGMGSELASDADASTDDAAAVTGDVLHGEEQDDVLRLLDSLNRDGARPAGAPAAPPRLLPVGSPSPQIRMTASAPPPPLDPLGSPAPPRSVSSDPGGGESELAPSLQDLMGSGGEAAAAQTAGDGEQSGGQQEGAQPMIRMAPIAANIPDERSFRHEAATPAPPSLQPRPDMDPAAMRPPGMPGPGGMPPQLTPAGMRLMGPGAPPPPGMVGPGGPVTCFVCHIPLPDVRALQTHLLTHQNAMQCTMCPFKANNVAELKAHSVTFHGKMQPGAIGRPPNSNMSAHVPGLGPPAGAGAAPPAGLPPGAAQRFQPQIRRGRPPLEQGRHLGSMAPQMNGMRVGMMPRGGMMRPGQPILNRQSVISPNKRPGGPGVADTSPNKRARPLIPIQPDKSDCQVIAVQRRQQGVPVIQNVEGNSASAAAAAAAGIRLSSSITMTVQNPPPPKKGSDVASILANRGISITPAASAPAAPAPPPLNIPNLPAGISLTPAKSSGGGGADDQFAVPRPPGGHQQTSPSRPSRPPTVDLTTDTPREIVAGRYICRYCERELPSAMALTQHEKQHLTSTAGGQNLRCRVCGIVMQNMALLQQHMQQRHGSTVPPAVPGRGGGALAELVVPVFDLSQVSRDHLESLGVRGFIPVSQVNQRQGQLGLPIISLQGLGKTGPSPRPVAFFNLGPVKPLRP